MGNAWTTANIPSLTGKNIIVTGANSGTGYYTALALGKAGASVVLACRSKERGEAAIAEMKKVNPNGAYELRLLDLSSLKDVERFAEEYNKEGKALDILVNNAGIMKPPFAKSADGFESQLAANHLGHFALTGRLIPSLEKSAAPRVVAVASLAAWRGKKTFKSSPLGVAASALETSYTTPDVDFVIDFVKDEKTYDADAIYGETKLANLLFMRELAKRHPKIMAVAAHPGITASNLWQHNEKQDTLKMFMQSSENGALPLLRAATESVVTSGVSYFAPRGFGWAGAPVAGWFPTLAKDDTYCNAYWEASIKATGVNY